MYLLSIIHARPPYRLPFFFESRFLSFIEDKQVFVDNSYKHIVSNLLKAVRSAEKQISKKKRAYNYLAVKPYIINSKLRELTEKEIALHKEYQLSGCITKRSEWQESKKKTKLATEKLKEINMRKINFDIEKDIYKNPSQFWRKAKKRKSMNNTKYKSQIPVKSYLDHYKSLFSHIDRPNSKEHDKVTAEVDEYGNKQKTIQFNTCTITTTEIATTINNLDSKKAAGSDHISNEMLLFGGCTNLFSAISALFNTMLKYGIIPNKFYFSLVTPIPKKGKPLTLDDSRPISVSPALTKTNW